MEFRVLGPLEVSDDGRPIAIGGQKQRALLALLLLHANEVVSRDRLIDELWEEDPPETARTALQVHISQLRKAVGRERILTQAPGYRAVVGPGELDLDRFEQLAGDGADAAELREALALWRGAPLADLGDGFARMERGRLDEQRLLTLERRIDADLALGGHAELVPELDGLVREHPLREHLRGQLMLALYRCGRQADALDVYRQGRQTLSDELGLEPGEELRGLERAILAQDESLAAPARARAAPVDVAAGRRPRAWLVAVLGVVLVAGAAAAGIVLASRGSAPVPVRPNSVAALDAESGKAVADVPIGGSPIALARGAGSVWAVDGDHSTVSRIDERTKERVPLGGLGSDLKDLAFGFGALWVAGGNDGTVLRIDPRDDGIRPIDLGSPSAPVFAVRVGERAVWAMRGSDVVRIDPDRNVSDGRVPVRSGPVGIALGLGSLWVSTLDEKIVRVDSRTLKRVYGEDVGDQAFFPVIARRSLWTILVGNPPAVAELDAGTLTQSSSVALPHGFPYQLVADGGVVWWVDPSRRAVYRLTRGSTRPELVASVPHHPVAIAPGGRTVWVGVQARPFD
ncbi:MAG TPA: BTAD domain-containing putative transcriptional regulator [Gaiellaceae bacterium]|nr:BTAD domain-containing putative transcriptional regulator [Gaiellaceae bacterium]